MSPNAVPTLSRLAGKGQIVPAAYREAEIPTYRGNPLIEALPPILTEAEATVGLARYPAYDAEQRQAPAHLRFHWIQSGLKFFAPLPIHLDLERRFSCLIRAGYEERNPVRVGFWQDLDQKVRAVRQGERPRSHVWSIATGFNILGMSGVGKTTSVQSLLTLYPQVIHHSHYRGRDFTHSQLTWLKLDCPFDGSIRGLCLNFFQAVDDILQTHYSQNCLTGRRTVDELLPHMARVAALHCLGVLVVDEIQHLSQAKSGGSEKMLNFFVQLVNTIGVPVVLVGTYKAMALLSGEFRQIRRGTGQGDLVWDRMAEDPTWQLFLESLWGYQYTRKPYPLTETLSHVLYEETQGITDFAVKVYMLAQIRAITSGKEAVTESVIRSVARDSLRLAAPVLEALRRRDHQALRRFEDVHPLDFDRYLHEAQEKVPVVGPITTVTGDGTVVENETPPERSRSDDTVRVIESAAESPAMGTPEKGQPPKSGTARRKATALKGELLKVVSADKVTSDQAAYEALGHAGYLRPAREYLQEEAVE